jgi:iron complex outermembrane recepter protein
MSRKTGRNASKNAAKGIRAAANQPAFARITIPGVALGAFTFSGQLLAADAGPAAPAASSNDADTLQEVVVTGIRASLQRSLDIKQQAVGVVDAVSAEDIGQFPDASIGEALSRIPGVTVNRGSINGAQAAGAPTATGNPTGVTVRGFGTQFNEILSEGRQLASGNGQSFDFAALGAEYVGELDIHKTPDFALSAGAVGATINVKSPLPFDHYGPQAQAFGSLTNYQKDGGTTPAFGALFSDTFADNTFGILIAGDYTDKHILGHHFDDVGWKGAYLPCPSFATAPANSGCTPANSVAGSTVTSAVPSWYIQDQAMYLERTNSRRKDGRLALQWRPSDTVLVTVDDNFSSDEEVTDRWQYSEWFGCFPSSCSNVTQDSNGTITNFIYANGGQGSPTDFNAFANRTYITTNTPGLNVRWDASDQWTGMLDVAQSTSHLNPNHTWTSLDSDVGYGPNTNHGTNGSINGVVVTGGGNSLPYWTAYGPNTNALTGPTTSANFLGQNPFLVGSHVLPIQEQINTDKINQAKLEGTWHTNDTQVNFGFHYVEDIWDSQELDTFTNNEWQLWSGYGPLSNNVTDAGIVHGVALPQSMFTGANITPFIPGYANTGKLPPALELYNPYAVLAYLSKLPPNADFAPSTGYTYAGGQPVPVLSTGSVQHVDRKNYAPFVTAMHNFDLGGDMSLKVNVGMRYEKTNVDIAGLAAPLLGLTVLPGDLTAYGFSRGPATNTTAHNSYGYFLPSLDLNLLLTPQVKIRFDYSRTESPPNNGQLIPNTNYGGRVNALTATGNNPNLLPYLSQNFDLGAEWYYASNDYVAVDGFFKHVTQFPVSSIQNLTVPGVTDTSTLSPNFGNPAVFAESTITNGLAANVTGIEATLQQMLGGGFGFQVNGTYVHSNANFNPNVYTANQFALPGIGNSANLIAFYQNYGFQARFTLQWQGDQLLALGQEQSGGAFGNEPVYLKANTELDYSMQYDINSHLNVFFEAINLTDNIYHTVGRFDNQTLNVVDYGRSFTLGVRAKF